MERQTRAQQRAASIDVSPARLAAEIERLTRERDMARRQAELARQELAQAASSGAGGTAGSDAPGAVDADPRAARGRNDARTGRGRPGAGRQPDAGAAATEELARERDEYLAALQRERAEFVNFRRRTTEERDAMLGLAAESLLRKVLAVADDFDLAVEHRPEGGGADAAWVEGIVAIDRKLRQLLESEGVTPVDASPGTRFDPHEHEAVANVPGTGRPGGEIVDELRRGYRLRDRVLRPALVAVAEDTGDETATGPSESHSSEPIH
jgi:molecular chaperone GrpE